jgi:hypothetical protein
MSTYMMIKYKLRAVRCSSHGRAGNPERELSSFACRFRLIAFEDFDGDWESVEFPSYNNDSIIYIAECFTKT